MAFARNAGFTSAIATNPADTAAGYLTPDRYNLAHVVSDATVGGIPYCPTATTETTSANLTYAETSGPRLQVGSGSTTSAGWLIGYFGTSGYAGLWNTGLAAATNNFSIAQGSAGNTLVNSASGQNLDLQIANSTKWRVDSAGDLSNVTAGQRLGSGRHDIVAGTTTTDLQALSITQTMNAAAVNFTGSKWTFTEGASGTGAGTLLHNILYGTSGAEASVYSLTKGGTGFFAGNIELGHASANTLSASGGVLSVEGVVIPSISSTNTLTNKRVTRRKTTTTGTAPTWNTDNCDALIVTAINGAINLGTNMTLGTHTNDDSLIVNLTDDGTGRAITWGTNFAASAGVALPTTTVASTTLRVGFLYDETLGDFVCVAKDSA